MLNFAYSKIALPVMFFMSWASISIILALVQALKKHPDGLARIQKDHLVFTFAMLSLSLCLWLSLALP
jgi:hypothetical protein